MNDVEVDEVVISSGKQDGSRAGEWRTGFPVLSSDLQRYEANFGRIREIALPLIGSGTLN